MHLHIAPFTFSDLFNPHALKKLSDVFDHTLEQCDASLFARFNAYRTEAVVLSDLEESRLLVEVGAHVGSFVARLFGVEKEAQVLFNTVAQEKTLFAFQDEYIHKRVRKKLKEASLPVCDTALYERVEAALGGVFCEDPEMKAAHTAMTVLGWYQIFDKRPAASDEEIAQATRALEEVLGEVVQEPKTACAQLLETIDLWNAHRMRNPLDAFVSSRVHHNLDVTHQKLVPLERTDAHLPEALHTPAQRLKGRDGFDLTDTRMSSREAHAEVHYCMLCHERGKDSCSKGLLEKSGAVKKTPLGVNMAGCPLDEKISEAHTLRSQGHMLGALAVICIDNPMLPGTGHRICNDCMKACIFQKQEPVNIPEVETGILTDVLALPYGFEMYSLLTRWNPLNKKRPYALPYRGHNVLVVGLGPAGYTLAHYLLNEGFGVVGIDGLKLEPLPAEWLADADGNITPVERYSSIEEPLSTRIAHGFGGVAEYGITVRWDKNFLKVIYLNLLRRNLFSAHGGIRFGGTLTLQDAWEMGFDHVALAAGAGRPTLVPMKNNMLRGIRKASDFLMGLQLTGAFKADSLANVQVQLPALVVGGGLTAIDTATELAAYYPVQVEKLLTRVETLGYNTVAAEMKPEEKSHLDIFLEHAHALRKERASAHPNVAALLKTWGGVSVCYRKSLVDSPAYRLNHEEVDKALQEGITFVEHVSPVEAVPDANGHLNSVVFKRQDGSLLTLPARALMVAAGTSPNTIYEKEHPGTFALDTQGKYFQAHTAVLTDAGVDVQPASSNTSQAFFTSHKGPQGQLVSYYGDNHPAYAGNVVKAMASAKHGHTHVAALFQPSEGTEAPLHVWQQCQTLFTQSTQATVHSVQRLTSTIVEIVVHAPLQAKKFLPGQFFRLQNFERSCTTVKNTPLAMEGLALTGAWVNAEQGLLSMIALEMGSSSRLCALLKPGEQVMVMGPTGTGTHIPHNQNVLLCGGGLGNAVLFSVAKAMKQAGNRVVYFAAYRHASDMFKREDIEEACDQVVWSVDQGDVIPPHRPCDRTFKGNIVQAMQAYHAGALGVCEVPFETVEHSIVIGSDRMMEAVTRARQSFFAGVFPQSHQAVASINSPMQCMMKEVCAQCLQKHVHPITGEETFVFSCFNQDQPADHVDWGHLNARLKQNTVLEKVSNLWLNHCL